MPQTTFLASLERFRDQPFHYVDHTARRAYRTRNIHGLARIHLVHIVGWAACRSQVRSSQLPGEIRLALRAGHRSRSRFGATGPRTQGHVQWAVPIRGLHISLESRSSAKSCQIDSAIEPCAVEIRNVGFSPSTLADKGLRFCSIYADTPLTVNRGSTAATGTLIAASLVGGGAP
jgi:hypothetical protein